MKLMNKYCSSVVDTSSSLLTPRPLTGFTLQRLPSGPTVESLSQCAGTGAESSPSHHSTPYISMSVLSHSKILHAGAEQPVL